MPQTKGLESAMVEGQVVLVDPWTKQWRGDHTGTLDRQWARLEYRRGRSSSLASPADWRSFNNFFGPAQAGLFCNEDK
jgi:hypothetical protein